jgi:hypothetical protein
MKRTLAKMSFIAVALVIVFAISEVISRRFPGFLTGGLGGGFGALVLVTFPKLFDRLWPKPMSGWKE